VGKLVPECQTVLDVAAARCDGGGGGDNWNSRHITTNNIPTLIFSRPDVSFPSSNQQRWSTSVKIEINAVYIPVFF